MRKLLLGIAVLSAFIFLPAKDVQAYEVDTHFYLTYVLSRHVGFNHQFATQFALGAQWIDESKKTSPMDGRPFKGIEMRRRFHFPAYSEHVDQKAHGITANFWGRIKSFTEAQPNHAVGSILIDEGLRDGNWLVFSAGLHILEDTYGHAGYSAEFGHAEGGHNPDRPELAMDKYKVMINRVTHALWAARQLTDNAALDEGFRAGEEKSKILPEDLADSFINDSGYLDIINNRGLTDPHYVQFSIEYLLQEMKKRGFIYEHVDISALVPKIEELEQSHQHTAMVMTKFLTPLVFQQIGLLKKAFNYSDNKGSIDFSSMEEKMIEKGQKEVIFKLETVVDSVVPGQPIGHISLDEIAENLEKDYALITGEAESADKNNQRLRGIELLTFMAVQRVAQGKVPRPFSSTHKVEFEDDGPNRQFELNLKTAYIQKFIQDTYGEVIEFDPAHMPNILKKAWNTAFDAGKLGWFKVLGKDEAVKELKEESEKAPEAVEVVTLSKDAQKKFDKAVGGKISYLKSYQAIKSGNTEEVNAKTQAYQYPELFLRLVKGGEYKPLIGEKEIQSAPQQVNKCSLTLSKQQWGIRKKARKAAGLE